MYTLPVPPTHARPPKHLSSYLSSTYRSITTTTTSYEGAQQWHLVMNPNIINYSFSSSTQWLRRRRPSIYPSVRPSTIPSVRSTIPGWLCPTLSWDVSSGLPGSVMRAVRWMDSQPNPSSQTYGQVGIGTTIQKRAWSVVRPTNGPTYRTSDQPASSRRADWV